MESALRTAYFKGKKTKNQTKTNKPPKNKTKKPEKGWEGRGSAVGHLLSMLEALGFRPESSSSQKERKKPWVPSQCRCVVPLGAHMPTYLCALF